MRELMEGLDILFGSKVVPGWCWRELRELSEGFTVLTLQKLEA
jgi:hypothetical protein